MIERHDREEVVEEVRSTRVKHASTDLVDVESLPQLEALRGFPPTIGPTMPPKVRQGMRGLRENCDITLYITWKISEALAGASTHALWSFFSPLQKLELKLRYSTAASHIIIIIEAGISTTATRFKPCPSASAHTIQ